MGANFRKAKDVSIARARATKAESAAGSRKSPYPHGLGNRAVSHLLSKPAGTSPGLSRDLKTGIENLSGVSMNDVHVHYNSSKPAGLKALAYTQDDNIYLGPGQESHLAHEAWHIVQQRQGRVKETRNSVNTDSALEAEADRMGGMALNSTSPGLQRNLSSQHAASNHVVQRKKVPDPMGANDYGQFETTRFRPANDSGVNIILLFHPNKNKADASKIGLVQSVRAFNEQGTSYAVSPTMANRIVKSASGEGYTIDSSGKTNNPLYFDTKNLGASQDLKDTPTSTVTNPTVTPVVGSNTHYELGYSYKKNPQDAQRTTHDAGLNDEPQGIKRLGAGMTFETAALAIDGADKGKYYGSVSWGYKIGGTATAPKVEAGDISDITLASSVTPTANFIEAAKLWNTAKTMGTLVVSPPDATQADAYVQYVQGSGPRRVARGTKLKQLDIVKGSTEGMIKAEIFNPDGTLSGNIVNIYVADVKDLGDGSANKALPTT